MGVTVWNEKGVRVCIEKEIATPGTNIKCFAMPVCSPCLCLWSHYQTHHQIVFWILIHYKLLFPLHNYENDRSYNKITRRIRLWFFSHCGLEKQNSLHPFPSPCWLPENNPAVLLTWLLSVGHNRITIIVFMVNNIAGERMVLTNSGLQRLLCNTALQTLQSIVVDETSTFIYYQADLLQNNGKVHMAVHTLVLPCKLPPSSWSVIRRELLGHHWNDHFAGTPSNPPHCEVKKNWYHVGWAAPSTCYCLDHPYCLSTSAYLQWSSRHRPQWSSTAR